MAGVLINGGMLCFVGPSAASGRIFDSDTRGEVEAARPRDDRGRERRALQNIT